MGHFTLEIIQERRTPASFAVSTLTLRVLLQLDALRVCTSHGRALSSVQTLRAFVERRAQQRRSVSAFLTLIDSSLAWTQARPNREGYADQALKALASGSLPHSSRHTAGFSAGEGGGDAPLGQTASASEAVATRRAPLPRSARLGWSGVRVMRFSVNENLFLFDKCLTSSRNIKTAAPLPLDSPLASRSLQSRDFAKITLSRASSAVVGCGTHCGDARRICTSHGETFSFVQMLRAQGSGFCPRYWLWLRSGRHAHTALSLPSLICPERGAASFADRLAASGKNTSTRQAARSARERPPSLAFTRLRTSFRVDAHPPINTNLSTTILLKPINGAKNAPLDASLFNNISLLKAWRVSAPLPPRSYPLARRAQGVRRVAPERRGGPGAFESNKRIEV
jgi:hypothetical protein